LYAQIASASADVPIVWHRGESSGRNNLPPRLFVRLHIPATVRAVQFRNDYSGARHLFRRLALCVAAYALSPIDLIPDFIPVVGHVDDWIVVTWGSLAVAQLLPLEVIAEHRAAAAMASERNDFELSES
jgi:uncharacterized membrane protein YkvA (DUF1232 family)